MIRKLKLLLWIGIVLLFVPFFGVPDGVRTALTIMIGVLVIYLSMRITYGYKKLKFESRPQVQEQATDIIHG